MEINRVAKLLRIFFGYSDRIGSVLVYEKIVLEANNMDLAGATVFKGFMGLGQSSRLHTAKILRLSEYLPILIGIIDEEAKINSFLTILDKIFEKAKCGGIVTMEKVDIIKYTGRKQS